MIKRQSLGFKQVRYALFLICSTLFFVRCNVSTTEKTQEKQTDLVVTSSEPTGQILAPINYHLIVVEDSLKWLSSLQTGDTLSALLYLNRVDTTNLLKLDTLVVPDTFKEGIAQYTPFPISISALRPIRKIILISHAVQAFAVYEYGKQIRWGPVSLGKNSTPTPTGLFATNWKSKKTRSTVNRYWVLEWYCNLDNYEGVGMHQYAMPGYPASHGCVRLYKEDAFWFYNWTDQWIFKDKKMSAYGTPVVIFGTYPYQERKPWLRLAENNRALKLTPVALTHMLKNFLPIVLERQETQDKVVKSNDSTSFIH